MSSAASTREEGLAGVTLDASEHVDGHGDSLSFDQFHAKMDRKRRRRKEEMAAAEGAIRSGKPRPRAGALVELFEVQLAVVALILLDVLGAVAQALLSCRSDALRPSTPSEVARAAMLDAASSALSHLSAFTIVFFFLECAVLMVSFGRRFWLHIGYVSDVTLLCAIAYLESAGAAPGVRVLGIVRLWRAARLANAVVAGLRAETRAVEEALDGERRKVAAGERDKARLEDAVRREAEARKAVEDMVRHYRDEVETLNEALNIAALDIFAAAAGEEPDGQEHSPRAGTGTGDGERDRGRNGTAPGEDARAAGRLRGTEAKDERERVRIVVNEDFSREIVVGPS